MFPPPKRGAVLLVNKSKAAPSSGDARIATPTVPKARILVPRNRERRAAAVAPVHPDALPVEAPPVIIKEEFELDGFTWYLVDTGVPHLVTIVDDLEKYDHDLSSKLRYEHNANVNFARRLIFLSVLTRI